MAEEQATDLAEVGLTAEQAYKIGLLTAEFASRAVAEAEQRVWARAGDVARGVASRLRDRADEKDDPVDRKHWRAMSAGASSVAFKLVEVSDSAGLAAPGSAPKS